MAKKLLSQLLDENGNEILYSGALVVDAATNTTFSGHVADGKAHVSATQEADAGKVLKAAGDGTNYWDTLPVFGDLAAQNRAELLTDTALTGVPTVPTAPAGTSTTQAASTAYVERAVGAVLGANDAMVFRGVVDAGHALPEEAYLVGWTYKVNEAGTYAGQPCEVGDMLVCVKAFAEAAADADWTVVQTNIDGAVTGPAAAVSGHIAVFDGATGKLIKDSGALLPADPKFTDTTYAAATSAADGLLSAADKAKLDTLTKDGSGNLVCNGKTLGETGIAFAASVSESPVFTGKLRMILADYQSPADV